MLGSPACSGRTSWMNWLRRPRLNSAVHSVAVLTAARRARVVSDRAVMAVSEAGRAGSENVGLGHGRAEAGFQEIEVAAVVGLQDVLRVHPAVAALIALGRRRPGGAARGQFGVADVQVDAARRHV